MIPLVLWVVLGTLVVLQTTVKGVSTGSIERGYPRIIDGDSIEINGKNIRLQGIDAPETRQLCKDRYGSQYKCGIVSTNKLKWKIGKKPITCMLEDKRDYYGRYLGYCSLSMRDTSSMDVNTSLNAWMVYWGYAVSYRYYSQDFLTQEQRAKRLRRGLWSGSFEMPWDWRKDN